jgi:hypothetical protein
MMTLELLGVGLAPRHYRGAFGDAQIRLAQLQPTFAGQPISPLIAACSSSASVGNVIALGWTVVSTVTRLMSRVRSAPVACATRKLSASRSSSLLPSRFLQWLRSERSCGNSCWKNSSPTKRAQSWRRRRPRTCHGQRLLGNCGRQLCAVLVTSRPGITDVALQRQVGARSPGRAALQSLTVSFSVISRRYRRTRLPQ